MILTDLFEGRMKDLISAEQDLETAYQSWLHSRGRGAMSDQEFQQEFGLNRRNWAIRNRAYIVARQSVPQEPDAHLYPERQGYRPVKKETVHEENQLDRNARIVAGEIEDALEQGDQLTAKQKLKELIKLGFYIDSNGQLQAMGMYEEVMEDLRKWFKEKWVRFGPDGKIRGACARGSKSEGKPKCLPQSKAHALGKKGRASAASKKRREDPNAERRGPARNVATKVKEQHDWDDADEFGMPGSEFFPEKQPQGHYKVYYMTATDHKLMGRYATQDEAEQRVRELKAEYPDNTFIVFASQRGMKEQQELDEKQDACYRKVKARYKVWPSAYASGALVQCRKRGAANWGKGSKKK